MYECGRIQAENGTEKVLRVRILDWFESNPTHSLIWNQQTHHWYNGYYTGLPNRRCRFNSDMMLLCIITCLWGQTAESPPCHGGDSGVSTRRRRSGCKTMLSAYDSNQAICSSTGEHLDEWKIQVRVLSKCSSTGEHQGGRCRFDSCQIVSYNLKKSYKKLTRFPKSEPYSVCKWSMCLRGQTAESPPCHGGGSGVSTRRRRSGCKEFYDLQ